MLFDRKRAYKQLWWLTALLRLCLRVSPEHSQQVEREKYCEENKIRKIFLPENLGKWGDINSELSSNIPFIFSAKLNRSYSWYQANAVCSLNRMEQSDFYPSLSHFGVKGKNEVNHHRLFCHWALFGIKIRSLWWISERFAKNIDFRKT